MDTNRKVFGNSVPTLGTELRGVFSGNFYYQTPSFFRFSFEDREEPEPCRISHRPVEATPTIPRLHSFNEDSVIVFKQLISNLEMEVSPLIVDFIMSVGNQHPRLSPSVRPLDSTGKPLLPHGEHILRFLKEARILYLHSFRGSEKGLTADINANTPISLRQRLCRHIITGKAHIPLIGGSPADGDGFNISLNWARQLEFEPTNIPDRQVFAVKLPACLFQGKGIIPILAFEPGEASLAIAVFDSPEEAGIGFIETLKNFLKHLRASFSVFRKRCFEFGKLLNLVVAGNRTFVLMVNSDTLLKGGIIEATTKVKPIVGFLKCLLIRQKAILKGLFHLSCTVFSVANLRKGDKPDRAWPSVSPALKCGVLDGGF